MKKFKLGINAALALALALSLTACTKEQPAAKSENNGIQEPTTLTEDNQAKPEGTGETTTPTDMQENGQKDGQDTGKDNAQNNVIQGTGTYNGQIDTHSIEIQTADGPKAFQIDDKLSETVAGLKEKDTIKFEYVEQKSGEGADAVTQLILKKIEKSE